MAHICEKLEKVFAANGEAAQRIRLLDECENYCKTLSDRDLASVAVTSLEFVYCNPNVRRLFFRVVRDELKVSRETKGNGNKEKRYFPGRSLQGA